MSTNLRNGSVAALAAFGLSKEARFFTNPRLMGALAGAGVGAFMAPEGQGLQGAALGGTAGYLGGAAIGGGARAAAGRVQNMFRRPVTGAASAAPAGARGPLITPVPQHPIPTPPMLPAGVGGQFISPPMGPRPAAPFARGAEDAKIVTASYLEHGINKVAMEFGVGTNLPGTPLNVGYSHKSKEERLPGMNRWVDRDVLERALQGTSDGLDAQALVDLEGDRGRLSHPALGALLGGGLTKHFLPKSGNAGAALASLIGAGSGALYNQATAGDRRDSMVDALRGVYQERGFPLQGQGHSTANEPPSMLLSRGGGAAV
jgi:hypothetical protein